MILRRIDPLSLAKVLGLVYAALGLVVGGFVSLFALVGAFAAMRSHDDEGLGLLFGVGAVIVLPIVYGVMGAIGGLILALFYNLVARLVGGVEFELVPKAPSS